MRSGNEFIVSRRSDGCGLRAQVGTHSMTPPGLLWTDGARSRGGDGPHQSQSKAGPESGPQPPSGLAQILPAPFGALECVQGKQSYTGSRAVTPYWEMPFFLQCDRAAFSRLSEQKAPASDGRSSQGRVEANGIFPITSEGGGPTPCLERDGGGAEAGGGGYSGSGGQEGRCSQQDPEEAHSKQEPPWKGPGTLQCGGRPVAETSRTALPDDAAKYPGSQYPVILHVGVGTPGGTALAEHSCHLCFCKTEEVADGRQPVGSKAGGHRRRHGGGGGVLPSDGKSPKLA